MPRTPATFIVWAVFSAIFACAFFADGEKYKGSGAVMLAVSFLLIAVWPTFKARFLTAPPAPARPSLPPQIH